MEVEWEALLGVGVVSMWEVSLGAVLAAELGVEEVSKLVALLVVVGVVEA